MYPLHYRLEPLSEPEALNPEADYFQREGVLTTFRVDPDEPVLDLDRHLDRLRKGCDFFGYQWPWETADSLLHLYQTVLGLASEQFPVVRIGCLPEEPSDIDTLARLRVSVILSLRPMPESPAALRLKQVRYDRVFPEFKHFLPGPEQWLLPEVKASGWDDYLRLTASGEISEASYANVFGVTGENTLWTPEVETSGCLPGIMRQAIIEICHSEGIRLEIGRFSSDRLSNTTGLFLTNAVRGLMPVKQVDEWAFAP